MKNTLTISMSLLEPFRKVVLASFTNWPRKPSSFVFTKYTCTFNIF